MKESFKGAVLAAALLATGYVYASGNTGPQVIDRLIVPISGLLVIEGADGDWGNPDGCDRSNKLFFESATDGVISDTRAQIAAVIAAAKLKGVPASFNVNGCYLQNGFTYPKPVNVILEPVSP